MANPAHDNLGGRGGERGGERGDEQGGVPARPWSVGELTRRIGAVLGNLGRISVEGEVSRITRAASGHVYFDLKDIDAKLACKIWKSALDTALRFELSEGAQVIVHGKLDVWGPHGTYSLTVQRVEHAGLGAMLAALERVKAELRARGWFDRKRALPAMPRLIGVVTSRDGAALQDFLRTRSLRWPGYPLRLRHTPVQGAGAAAEIARAIAHLDQSGVDAIVLCRGGGSIEDLWAFNELVVAEAIWSASVPVVTGIGHEVDVTLADLIADHRAHTPTDAAQHVIPDRRALLELLERRHHGLAQAIDEALASRGERLERAAGSRVLHDARWILEDRGVQLERLVCELARCARRAGELGEARMIHAARRLERSSPAQQLARRVPRVEVAAARLPGAASRAVERSAQRLALLESRLSALSPLRVLERGYTITCERGGAPLVSADTLRTGDELETVFARGRATSQVTRVDPSGARQVQGH
jgi:exodeoxyribonuclease VII large subunit